MKKALIASVLGIVASVAPSQGQGFIQFNNYQSQTYQPVRVNGVNATSPTIEVQLFWGLEVISDPTLLTAGNTAFIDSATFNTAGSFGGGPGGYFSDGVQTLAGYASGQATFMVQAWDTSTGATFASASVNGQSLLWQEGRSDGNGGFGIAKGVEPVGFFGSGPGAATPGVTPLVNLTIVPEPSTFALLGLGTAGLWFFRRRK